MKFTRIVILLFVILFLKHGIARCEEKAAAYAKVQVITTLFPFYDFAKQIGDDRIAVSLLVPPGVEAHTFEPKPADIVRINKADIFIYSGKFMEPWVKDLLKGVPNKGLLVVDASKGITLMDEKEEESQHTLVSAEHSEQGGKDPHIWLDLSNDQAIVDTIAGVLEEKDSPNAEFYRENAGRYKAKLALLDQRFKSVLSGCRIKTFIYGGHFAFGYFAKRYGLAYISPYRGFSPDAEPTPKSITELIVKMKQLHIKYIYHEELIDPKVARVIAGETGAKLLLLHGAHNVSKEDLREGLSFISIMEENLNKLKLGLECQ